MHTRTYRYTAINRERPKARPFPLKKKMEPLKGINTKWEGEKISILFLTNMGTFFNKEKEMRVQLYKHTLAITSKLLYFELNELCT